MVVTVAYLAQIRRAVGTSRETIDCPLGTTLVALLRQLGERHGSEFANLLFDEAGSLRKTWLYFVADEQATPDRILREGDEVTILAPMAGGG